MNEKMIFTLWLAGAAVIVVLATLVCMTIIGSARAKHGRHDPNATRSLISGGVLIQFISIPAILAVTAVLAINGIIDGQPATSMLFTVLGFVFGKNWSTGNNGQADAAPQSN